MQKPESHRIFSWNLEFQGNVVYFLLELSGTVFIWNLRTLLRDYAQVHIKRMHNCFSLLIQPKSSMGKTQTIQRAGSASRARASSDKFSHVKSSGYGVVHPSPTRTRSSSPGKAKGKTSAKKSPSKKSPSTSRHQSPEKGNYDVLSLAF